MKIFIGADHAGFILKEKLKKYLRRLGFNVKDFGAEKFNPSDDYPDFVIPAAVALARNPHENRGIIIGGSGQGEAIVANKVKGIRAAMVYDEYSAKMSREHNNANVIVLGARTMDFEKAKKIVKLWLNTPFSGASRHKRRLKKIAAIEK